MEYEKCYVFEPERPRAAKRRKIERHGLQTSWPVRHAAYRSAWQAQEKGIEVRLAILIKAK
jgi:hypothetical protein